MTDTRNILNGYYKFDALTLGAGVIQRKNEASALAPKSNLTYLHASYQMTPAVTIDGGVMDLDFKNSADGATMYVLRGTYLLSKRTAVYASLSNLSNSGQSIFSVSGPGAAPGAGEAQSGIMLGLRHAF